MVIIYVCRGMDSSNRWKCTPCESSPKNGPQYTSDVRGGMLPNKNLKFKNPASIKCIFGALSERINE